MYAKVGECWMKDKKRRYSKRIQVVVSDDEYAQITESAKSVGLSNSAFLRQTGKGYAPSSIFDLDVVEKLIKLSADQGRYGGLLKMWLTNDERLAWFDQKELAQSIGLSLEKVNEIQETILDIIKSRKILAAKKRF